jgi:twinkle protein
MQATAAADIAAYIAQKGWQFKQRGAWLELRHCPFCLGGRHSDVGTFAVHATDGNYICKRGSCAVAGSFVGLQQHFGDKAERAYVFKSKTVKTFVAPEKQPGEVSDDVRRYLELRGFSEETWRRRGIGEADGDYKIIFPYFDENNNHVLNKFRLARKAKEGERKALRERGGKPVLWGMHLAHPSAGPLVITFGEYDALACDEAGILNAVSVPSGDQDLTWINLCWNWLAQFTEIILWPDGDESGEKALEEVSARLGKHRIKIVSVEFKDANEMLARLTKQYDKTFALEALREAAISAAFYPFDSIIDVADIPDEPLIQDGVRSGIQELDRITGGFRGSEATIWGGDNGSGKTTAILGVCVEAVEQAILSPHQKGNGPVFLYSGEMRKSRIQYWSELVLAGPRHLTERFSERTGRAYQEIGAEAKQRMREWYRGYFKLYDIPSGTNEDNLFETAEFAAMRYGCKTFVFDNLTVLTVGASDKELYRRQAQFVQHCKSFAVSFDVHVHLVVHNRKPTDADEPPTKAALRGAQELSDLVDNAGAFWRVPKKLKGTSDFADTDTLLCWFKTRDSGEMSNIRLVFDARSKRFAQSISRDRLDRAFAWEGQDVWPVHSSDSYIQPEPKDFPY